MATRRKGKRYVSYRNGIMIHSICAGFMIGIAFFVGSALNSGNNTEAAGSGTYLPIIKGGTGVGSLPNGVLVGNGTNDITSKSIATAATADSEDLISAGGVYSSILSMVYPVGSIYTSISPTNPSTFLPGTTWVAYGAGKTLVGVDTSQPEFDIVEKPGGAKTVSHNHTISVANSAAITTSSTPLTVAQIPSHTHTFTGTRATVESAGAHTHKTGISTTESYAPGPAGNTTAQVYWSQSYSDTSSAGAHTHYFTPKGTISNTGSGSGHTHTVPAHGHTASSTSISTSTLQPYITTYMWKRTN